MRPDLRHLANAVGRFLRRDAGVTAIEYGLLAALIAVAIVAAVSATGDSLEAVFNYWSTAVVNAIGN